MTQTTYPTRVEQHLASAIMHVADGLLARGIYDQNILDARLLVRELAFPPSPTPAPTCDAPHCGCATGEDCAANGVGDHDQDAIFQAVKDVMAANGDKVAQAKRNPDLQGWFVGKAMLALEGKADYGKVAAAVKARLAETEPSGAVDEGFINPRAASSREVRNAVMALQRALGVGEDGIVGPATMQAIEGIRAEGADERVMVRAVSPGHTSHDDELVEWDEWVLDPDATGHRAPFSPGDLVMYSNGREGLHRVLAVSVNKDAPRHRSLRLKVKPTDVVVDRDAF